MNVALPEKKMNSPGIVTEIERVEHATQYSHSHREVFVVRWYGPINRIWRVRITFVLVLVFD